MTQPTVMGIVNVTPDSFSGDGVLSSDDFIVRAVEQGLRMVEDGAEILDIGGESTRPGATPVSAEEEIRRTAPVIAALRARGVKAGLSIDTFKAATAEAALQAGADIVNDITGLRGDAAMAGLVARQGARVVLMHNRAAAVSGDSYAAAPYGDVVEDIAADLGDLIAHARAAGIGADQIILDPGVGFGKSDAQNIALIAHLGRFKKLGFPVLMGISRKSFIGHTLGLAVEERLEGTAACIAACVLNGADILRVHDVKAMARVARMAAAIRDA